MPIYAFTCPSCGKSVDKFLKLAVYDTPQTCECGETLARKITAPFIQPDYAPYQCPVTGKTIEGRKAHEANLRETGCRILEPGEAQASIRRKQADDEAFFDRIAESAAETVAAMPAAKQERLANELSAGLDVSFERTSL